MENQMTRYTKAIAFHSLLWTLSVVGLVYGVTGCKNIASFIIVVFSLLAPFSLLESVRAKMTLGYADRPELMASPLRPICFASGILLALSYVWFGHYIIGGIYLAAQMALWSAVQSSLTEATKIIEEERVDGR